MFSILILDSLKKKETKLKLKGCTIEHFFFEISPE